MAEESWGKKPEIGDRVRADHRMGGIETPELLLDPKTGFRHLIFRDWCGGKVAIIGFEGSRTRIGCNRCEFRMVI